MQRGDNRMQFKEVIKKLVDKYETLVFVNRHYPNKLINNKTYSFITKYDILNTCTSD